MDIALLHQERRILLDDLNDSVINLFKLFERVEENGNCVRINGCEKSLDRLLCLSSILNNVLTRKKENEYASYTIL